MRWTRESFFRTLKVRELLSKGIHPAFSLQALVEGTVGSSCSAKGYNFVGVPHPAHIASTCVFQSPLLRRIVFHQLVQGPVFRVESFCAPQIGLKEGLVAGYEVSAHAGFHIYQQLKQMPGLVENLIGMVNPPQRFVQVEGFP